MGWYAADCAPGGSCPVCNAPPEPACVHCGDDGVEGDYVWVGAGEEFVCEKCQSGEK